MGNTLHIGTKYAYKTIHAAISSAFAGDTLIVEKGIYSEENIEINKPLSIKGVDLPVVDGNNNHTLFTIAANNVTIEGFLLKNCGVSTVEDRAGIKMLRTRYCVIKNNILENTCFGIFLSNCSRAFISDNTLIGSAVDEVTSGGGIHMLHCDSNTICNNTVEKHRDGIYFEFVTHTAIYNNACRNNIRYGLHFMFSDNNMYTSNIFQNNVAGVAVMYSKHITMRNNTFRDNWGGASFGLYLKEIENSTITNNRFTRNTVGIDMEGTENTHIYLNTFSDNGWAMKVVSDCFQDTITQNNFENNSFDVSSYGVGHAVFNKNFWDDYKGYDLNNDGIGDIPFQPVCLFSMIVQECPDAIILLKSFIVQILNSAETMLPAFTPETEKDKSPLMKAVAIKY